MELTDELLTMNNLVLKKKIMSDEDEISIFTKNGNELPHKTWPYPSV